MRAPCWLPPHVRARRAGGVNVASVLSRVYGPRGRPEAASTGLTYRVGHVLTVCGLSLRAVVAYVCTFNILYSRSYIPPYIPHSDRKPSQDSYHDITAHSTTSVPHRSNSNAQCTSAYAFDAQVVRINGCMQLRCCRLDQPAPRSSREAQLQRFAAKMGCWKPEPMSSRGHGFRG